MAKRPSERSNRVNLPTVVDAKAAIDAYLAVVGQGDLATPPDPDKIRKLFSEVPQSPKTKAVEAISKLLTAVRLAEQQRRLRCTRNDNGDRDRGKDRDGEP